MTTEEVPVPVVLLDQVETILLRAAEIVHVAGYVETYSDLDALALKVHLARHQTNRRK